MKKWLIALCVLGLTAVAGYVAYNQLNFFVVSTQPNNGNDKTPSTSPVIVKFNKNLDPDTAKRFEITPRIQGSLNVDGATLTFQPRSSFQLNTTYKVLIKAPTSEDGKEAKDVSLEFTARYVEYSQLPKDQQQAQIQNSDSLEGRFPILSHIPHETSDYKIDYHVTNDDKLVLTITLYAILNRPEQFSNYQIELKQFKKEALDYIREQKQDPAKYQIEYLPPEAKDL